MQVASAALATAGISHQILVLPFVQYGKHLVKLLVTFVAQLSAIVT
jgi:hypothetical protein